MTVTLGAYVHQGQIERAAMATLQKWLRTHLGLLERELGYELESLPDPVGWGRRLSVDLGPRPHESTPAVLIAAGPTANVQRDGDGSYDASWPLQVAVFVASADEEDTRDMAGLYAVAIATCLVQHPWELRPVRCRWTGNTPNPGADTDHDPLVAGMSCFFDVYSDGVLTEDAGPTTPEPLPDPVGGGRPTYPDAPTADTVEITVNQS